MLPSICAPSTVLLLVYLVGVASSTEGGGSNQMLQPASLLELTVEESGLSTSEAINMTLFMWLYDMTTNVTNLTICTQESLIQKDENITTGPNLLYWLEGADETNIPGRVLEGNSSCSLFTMNGTVPLAKNETVYVLDLIVTIDSSTIFRSGSISFAMPVETSILSCRDETYTRAAGLPSNITFDFNYTCINDDQPSDDVVCYLEGEFSDRYLCYTTNDPPGLQVCLQGSSLNTMKEGDGQLTISYLAYDSAPDTDDAYLSLEFETQEPTYEMEAIIWKENKWSATSCLNTNCPIPAFAQGFVHYDVCAVILVDGVVSETSTDTITDMDLIQLPDNAEAGGSVLHFVFSNVLPEKVYRAAVSSSLPNGTNNDHSVKVDCSLVQENHGCFGFLSIEDLTGTVYLAVSREADDSNKVVSPYDTGVFTTTVAPQMMTMTQQQGSEQM